MKTVKGNLIDLAEAGKFDLIVQGCNCQCQMGSGIAKEIRARYPQVYEADCETTKGDREKLGGFTEVPIELDNHFFMIVNGYTQYNYGRDKSIQYVDYEAIRSVFKHLKIELDKYVMEIKIGYPKIGCGLAGGDWDIVSKIIDEELEGMDHTYVEFDG